MTSERKQEGNVPNPFLNLIGLWQNYLINPIVLNSPSAGRGAIIIWFTSIYRLNSSGTMVNNTFGSSMLLAHLLILHVRKYQ
jgi:hypothetical protein